MLNVDKNLPKISCLMVTAKGRHEHLVRSVQCFLDQTYPNKELVVVNEGDADYQDFLKNYLADYQNVRLVLLNGDYTLGALRNISIAVSRGDIFCQWDDDDFNNPDRLAIQARFLIRNPQAKVCYMSDQLHYYFQKRLLYWESWSKFHSGNILKYSLIPGTLMAWKKSFNYRYPSGGEYSRLGEDSILSFDICEKSSDIALMSDFGYIQVYSFHGKNVWDEDHHMNISQQRAMHNVDILKNKERIISTIKYLNLELPITIIGREGKCFTYE